MSLHVRLLDGVTRNERKDPRLQLQRPALHGGGRTFAPACRRIPTASIARALLILIVSFAGNYCLSAELPEEDGPASSEKTAEVVQQLVQHNELRASQLKCYTSRRHYDLEYQGFPRSAQATMDVEATYNAPAKDFRVTAETGSPRLINHVLKKLLKSEQEAAADPSKNALTPENYNFSLLQSTVENGHTVYVLAVAPKEHSKFLYRGKIWVDGNDFAVVRIEAEPSDNPSFWIKNTEIRHRYSKVGDFWLPEENKTVTKVRLGGTATLTISYGSYEIQPPSHPAHPSLPVQVQPTSSQ